MNFELLSFAESFISTMLADSIDWHVKNLTHVQQETKSVRIEQDFAKQSHKQHILHEVLFFF